eukprot:TRINITY_DN848_c0_g1_i1.p1 TRINITY_DN848_c0_g1~~TRINITY_DN848_c0_g1_i1.p1  ORF type:complete len:429 (+),score=71.70 TRINITY_DN848_c0_g1_i1:163-1449(+)
MSRARSASTSKKLVQDLSPSDVQLLLSHSFPDTNLTYPRDFSFDKLPTEVGLLNPIYKVDLHCEHPNVDTDSLIIKVTNPHWKITSKTHNEAVVGQFLSENLTSLGLTSNRYVPRIYAYDEKGVVLSSGLCYIVMNFVKGKRLQEVGINNLSVEKRQHFLNQYAEFSAACKSLCFTDQKIGCFGKMTVIPGGLSVEPVIIDDADTQVEPCDTFSKWIVKTMELRLAEANNIMDFDPPFYKPLIRQLRTSLDSIISLSDKIDEHLKWTGEDRLHLGHMDMNDNNILVDEETMDIKGVIDWEWASLMVPHIDMCDVFTGIQADLEYYHERQAFHWERIKEQYPSHRDLLGEIIPPPIGHPLHEKTYQRQKLFRLVEVTMILACMHTWTPENTWDSVCKQMNEDVRIAVADVKAFLHEDHDQTHGKRFMRV